MVEMAGSSMLAKAALVFGYLGGNISLNMMNKYFISLYGFRFPLAMSMAHMAFSFLALAPIMMLPQFKRKHAPTLQKQWLGLVAVGAFFAVNVGAWGRGRGSSTVIAAACNFCQPHAARRQPLPSSRQCFCARKPFCWHKPRLACWIRVRRLDSTM